MPMHLYSELVFDSNRENPHRSNPEILLIFLIKIDFSKTKIGFRTHQIISNYKNNVRLLIRLSFGVQNRNDEKDPQTRSRHFIVW